MYLDDLTDFVICYSSSKNIQHMFLFIRAKPKDEAFKHLKHEFFYSKDFNKLSVNGGF